jgi:F0F1-type ATP synthase membrane subunit c/vacuolar-type H+-ATPase subunit K
MRKLFEMGGLVAAVVLTAFGIGAVVMSIDGRSTVRDSLKLEQIVGSPDMTPAATAAAAKEAGLTGVTIPTLAVAGKPIDSGDRARAFAGYMRIHTLEATGGLTYAQMGRFVAKPGAPASLTDGHGGTNDAASALVDATTQRPVDNAARNIWVTETALTTALNTSYMAEQLALFGLVVGIALLLSGLGFAILAIGGALRNPETALTVFRRKAHPPIVPAV